MWTIEAPLPEGVEIRPVEDEHLRAIWEADAEAFRDLGVRTENPNGALDPYRSLGYEVVHTSTAYRKPL
jgi:ribosomal protein S18 acetylase RimI-like enzyme